MAIAMYELSCQILQLVLTRDSRTIDHAFRGQDKANNCRCAFQKKFARCPGESKNEPSALAALALAFTANDARLAQ